ncbi:hypothetical protein CYMTET_11157 [Cymbomonas tetramitiformis]|uniref:UBA domain-containing protein n=1 Tax=Cymbomonas tetramitiformis TaxID=36881 RepID=A0AAE0GN98_9CHLO|nr:hypothetical protein CYMTET_11157 [Cymbomonas tetramitiformis]
MTGCVLADGGCTDEELVERNGHGVALASIQAMRARYEHDWQSGDTRPPWERSPHRNHPGLASNKEEDALAKLSGEEREALTEKIETLTSMGFSDDVAISALLQCDGDVDSALDHLLEN